MKMLFHAAQCLIESTPDTSVVFVVCGWPNLCSVPSLKRPVTSLEVVQVNATSDLSHSDPIHFNVQRASETIPRLEKVVLEKMPEVIIYDFFAIEAVPAIRKFGLPSVCSVPAFVPKQLTPYLFSETERTRLREFQVLPQDSKEQQCFQMSDFFLVLTQPNENESGFSNAGSSAKTVSTLFSDAGLGSSKKTKPTSIWCYQPQELFGCSDPRLDVFFVPETHLSEQLLLFSNQRGHPKEIQKDTVLVSFGTVVTGNLWDKNASVRPVLLELYLELLLCLCETTDKSVKKIVVAAPRRMQTIQEHVLKHMDEKACNSKAIEWHDMCDQRSMLSSGRVAYFITHGGCNSVRESIICGVPMLVIPFFGDQHDAAKQVENLSFGIHCSYGPKDTDEPQSTARIQWKRSCLDSREKVRAQIKTFQQRLPDFHHCLHSTVKLPEDPRKIMSDWIDRYPMYVWHKPGDLFFGTNADRALLDRQRSLSLHVGNTQPFPNLYGGNDKLPKLIDQYHDLIIDRPNLVASSPAASKYLEWLKRENVSIPKRSEVGETKERLPNAGLKSLWGMCCKGLSYFIDQGCTIHFAIGPGFNPKLNRATVAELTVAHDLWLKYPWKRVQMRFYVFSKPFPTASESQCRWKLLSDPADHEWFGIPCALGDHYPLDLVDKTKEIHSQMETHRQEVSSKLVYHLSSHRIKDSNSLAEKMWSRRSTCIDDLVGWRYAVNYTVHVEKVIHYLYDKLVQVRESVCIDRIRVAEKKRLMYLVGRIGNAVKFEIQVWTSLAVELFCFEHDTIYKPVTTAFISAPITTSTTSTTAVTRSTVEESHRMRAKLHQLQDTVDLFSVSASNL